jgi:PTS system nitrogen regulatory IIA component
VLKLDDDIVFGALLKREELGSTGVGNGAAIPHLRLEQVKKPLRNNGAIETPNKFRLH